jgi:hypothetical protein
LHLGQLYLKILVVYLNAFTIQQSSELSTFPEDESFEVYLADRLVDTIEPVLSVVSLFLGHGERVYVLIEHTFCRRYLSSQFIVDGTPFSRILHHPSLDLGARSAELLFYPYQYPQQILLTYIGFHDKVELSTRDV